MDQPENAATASVPPSLSSSLPPPPPASAAEPSPAPAAATPATPATLATTTPPPPPASAGATPAAAAAGKESSAGGAASAAEPEANKDELPALATVDDKTAAKMIKKEIKIWNTLLERLPTSQQRERLLNHHHVMLLLEAKKLEKVQAKEKVLLDQVLRERDLVKHELDRKVLDKDDFERLCRELQRQNKSMQENCTRLKEENEKKRLEMEQRFQASMSELTEKLKEDTAARERLALETQEMRKRYNSFMEQFQLREEHIQKVFRSKDLEVQLNEAKIAQQLQLTQAAEQQLVFLKQRSAQLLSKEATLRGQLASYREKHGQFDDTLAKSAAFLSTYRTEKEAMLRKIDQRQAENQQLKQQCDQAAAAMAKLVEERAEQLQAQQTLKTRIARMEGLCRVLERERDELRTQLRALDPACPLLEVTAQASAELAATP